MTTSIRRARGVLCCLRSAEEGAPEVAVVGSLLNVLHLFANLLDLGFNRKRRFFDRNVG